MNQATFYIVLIDFNSKTTQDNSLMVTGKCLFKFSDRNLEDKEIMGFHAYGQTAQSLIDAGVGSIHVVSGRLNIYKRDENNLNPRLNLVIESAICFATNPEVETISEPNQQDSNPTVAPVSEAKQTDSNQTVPEAQPEDSNPTDNPNNTTSPKRELATVSSSKENLDHIPF